MYASRHTLVIHHASPSDAIGRQVRCPFAWSEAMGEENFERSLSLGPLCDHFQAQLVPYAAVRSGLRTARVARRSSLSLSTIISTGVGVHLEPRRVHVFGLNRSEKLTAVRHVGLARARVESRH